MASLSDVAARVSLVNKTRVTFQAGLKSKTEEEEEDELVVTEQQLATMNDFGENGWAHIHQAAFRGFHKSVEKFVRANEEQLELETGDDLGSTPLLLAVMNDPKEPPEAQSKMDTIKCLIELGAKIDAVNKQHHGVVELSAFRHFIDTLEYFIALDDSRVPVWKNLIKFYGSDSDSEAESAVKCLKMMSTAPEGTTTIPNWQPMLQNGVVPGIMKVIKGTISDATKIETFNLILNLLPQDEVREQFMSSDGIVATIKHLKSSNYTLITQACLVIKELALYQDKNYADQAVINDVIPAIVRVLQTKKDPTVQVEAVMVLSNIAEGRPHHQSAIGKNPNTFSAIVKLYKDCSSKEVLLALTHTVAKLAQNNEANQELLIEELVATDILALTLLDHKDIQIKAVEAIQALVLNNPATQRSIKEEGAIKPLMQLLKKSRQTDVQDQTAGALWALAGEDIEEQGKMASEIGIPLLIEFLASLSENLHYIGSEGLGVLAQGPLSKQTEIAQANGVHPLVRLLRSDKEFIVLSVVRTLRHLCVGVGYMTHKENQKTISQSRGIKFLVAMMAHSKNELIQVEAAHTLGCIALGNPENLDEMKENMDFSYVRILKMMYSSDPEVRLLAGSALAAFAYNNLTNQKDIAVQGGILFSTFLPFLQSDNEIHRCNAALQIVVLAKIIPDEEQAISSAAGIKLLVDLLQNSKNKDALALAADCIARLTHTRAGVPSAFIAISVVPMLCQLLTSQSDRARGCAAVALGYLSHYHDAKRQILNRTNPYLMEVLVHYTKSKLSADFLESWSHYKKIGLPTVKPERSNLICETDEYYTKEPERELIIPKLDIKDAEEYDQNQSTDRDEDEKTIRTARSIISESGATTQRSQVPKSDSGGEAENQSRRSSAASTKLEEVPNEQET